MPLRPLARIRCRRIFLSTQYLTIEKHRLRIADSEVVHPAAKDRVDPVNHLPHGLADVLLEDLPQLCKQRFPQIAKRISGYRRYQRQHGIMISASKCRRLNNVGRSRAMQAEAY